MFTETLSECNTKMSIALSLNLTPNAEAQRTQRTQRTQRKTNVDGLLWD